MTTNFILNFSSNPLDTETSLLSFDILHDEKSITSTGIFIQNGIQLPVISKTFKNDYVFQDFYWKEDIMTVLSDRIKKLKYSFKVIENQSITIIFDTIQDIKSKELRLNFLVCESNTFVLEKFSQVQKDIMAIRKTNELNYNEVKQLTKSVHELTKGVVEIKRLLANEEKNKTELAGTRLFNKRLADLNSKIENKAKETEKEVSVIRTQLEESHKIVRNLEDFLSESYIKTDEQFRLMTERNRDKEKEAFSDLFECSQVQNGKPVVVSELFEVDNVFVGYESYNHQVCAFTTAKNHSYLLYSTEKCKLVFYCMANCHVLAQIEGHLENITCIKHLTHGDKDYVVSSCSRKVLVHRVVGDELVRSFTVDAEPEKVASVVLYPKINRSDVLLAVASDYGSVSVYDMDGSKLITCKTPEDDNFDIGHFVWKGVDYLYTGNQCNVKVFSAADLEPVRFFKHPSFVYFIDCFERDNSVYIVGLFDKSIKIFDFVKNIEIVQCINEKSLAGLALWNEQYLLTADGGGNLKFYDMINNEIYKSIRIYEDGFISILKRFVDSSGRNLLVTGQWGSSRLKVLSLVKS